MSEQKKKELKITKVKKKIVRKEKKMGILFEHSKKVILEKSKLGEKEKKLKTELDNLKNSIQIEDEAATADTFVKDIEKT